MSSLLSTDQIAEYKEVFDLFDRDQDGLLTVQEFRAIMNSIGHLTTEAEFQDLLTGIQSDFITFEAFLYVNTERWHDTDPIEDLLARFKELDADGDGRIGMEALRRVVVEVDASVSDEEINELLIDAQVDANHTVDYQDFLRRAIGH